MSKSKIDALIADQGNPYVIVFKNPRTRMMDVVYDPALGRVWSSRNHRFAKGMSNQIAGSSVMTAREAAALFIKLGPQNPS